jgi:hypothetical protein
MPDDNGTYDMFAARFAEQMLIQNLKAAFKRQPWYHWDKLAAIFKDVPRATLTSLLLKIINNQSLIFENGNLQGHIIFRNNLFLFQPNKIQDGAIPISFRHGAYPVRRDYYEPEMVPIKGLKTAAAKKPTVAAASATSATSANATATEAPEGEAQAVVQAPEGQQNIQNAALFWTRSIEWLNSWCKDDAKKGSINEFISPGLSEAIMAYLDGDTKEKENIEKRLNQLQWWAKAIVEEGAAPGGIKDLRRVAKEFIWDSFFKGPEQIAMIEIPLASADEGGSEQFIKEGSITATRYLDLGTKEPVYF